MNLFDEVIDRHNTESYKWDLYNDPLDCIAMPVADMDFRCAQPIVDALNEVTKHGILGYSIIPDILYELLQQRLEEKYSWKTKKEWQVWIPGLIPAITSISSMIGSSGDSVIAMTPAYYPIHLAPGRVERNFIPVPLTLDDNRWIIDFDKLEDSITPSTKLFILCNPHNPGGTVFTKEELELVAAICLKNKIVVCSDEIHCDLILNNKEHIPVASLNKAFEQNTITLMAPSKTFNLAGLGCSVAIIPDPDLRNQFEEIKAGLFPFLSRYSIKAGIAAYRDCAQWHCELLKYLKSNHDWLYNEINSIEGLTMYPLEATYLAWIRSDIPDFAEKLLHHGIRTVDGSTYLQNGFFRLNFACPRSVLEEAMRRIRRAADTLRGKRKKINISID